MPYQLVIFDCDGVLVDSEPIYAGVFREGLAEIGLADAFDEIVHACVGRTWAASLVIIERHLGRPIPADFQPRLGSRLIAARDAHLEPVPGVLAMLERLSVPCCVASNGHPDEIRGSLRKAGLLPRFEGRMFSASEVARGKPAPDLFLHAAATLGAQPAACAVVEDTVVGVAAAVAAGMEVFAYSGTMTPEALAHAGARVFHDMAELPDLLA